MATVDYTLRIDESDKQEAEQIFGSLGLTFATGLNVYLKTVVRQHRIPFELNLNEKPATRINKVSQAEKERSVKALSGILAGYEIDLDKEREERILSR